MWLYFMVTRNMVFTFVDLCAGIGGFHIGCAAHGGKCIDAAEIDPRARDIYFKSFAVHPQHDVCQMQKPKHNAHVDLVCFGNPCQSFSTLGKRMSFTDVRGQVFFYICEYLKKIKPTCFIMENVPNFMWMDHGTHFDNACNMFREMNYNISYKILNTLDFGLPQNRARLFVIGHKRKTFVFAESNTVPKKQLDLFLDKPRKLVDVQPLLSSRFAHYDLTSQPEIMKKKSGFIIKAQYNRFTDKRLFSSHGTIGTILSQSSPFIFDEKLGVVRHLSPTELLRCQGFPVNILKFPPDMTRSQYVKYIGNSVSPKIVASIVRDLQAQSMLP